jgi:hypothetical protein
MPRQPMNLQPVFKPGRTAFIADRKIDRSIPAFAQKLGRARRLFREHSSRRGARRLFRRRDHECDPGIPAVGPVPAGKFPVGFEIEVTLSRGAQGNDESELRAGADHLRLEATHPIAGAAVASDFFVDIADRTDLKLLGQIR